MQLDFKAWPSLMPIVQSALNNSILERLGKRSPQMVFLNQPPSNALTSIVRIQDEIERVHSIEEVKLRKIANIELLQNSIEDMHRDVAERSSKKRKAAVESHNRRTHIRPINFVEGDFVLRAVPDRNRRKSSLRWKGPFRIVECRSDYIFLIEDLLSGEKTEAHGRRLKFFRNSSYEITEELLNHLAYQENELMVISTFNGIRRSQGELQVLAKWRGLSADEDSWEPVDTLREDVPDMLQDYIDSLLESGSRTEKKLAGQA